MKKIILRSIVSLMALISLTVAPAAFSAQPTLQGAWDTQVTATDCNGNILVTFRVFETFHQGGTSTGIGTLSPAPNIGTWQRKGMRTFKSTLYGPDFNPDGTPAGTSIVTRHIQLSADGNHFTSTATTVVFDTDGNLVFSGCGTDVATRLP